MRRAALLLGMALAAPAPADEGRLPISSAVTILGPGHYVLTRNVTTDDAITIVADGVILDLNGHTVETTAAFSPILVSPLIEARKGITIRNGRVRGGSVGVGVFLFEGGRILVENVEVEGSSAHGIQVSGIGLDFGIRGCLIRNVGNHGVYYQATAPTPYGRGFVEDNLVDGSGLEGIHLAGVDGSQVRRNSVLDAGRAGMVVAGTGNKVLDNTVHNSGVSGVGNGAGMFVNGPGNLLENNVVTASGAAGFELSASTGAVLRGNVASGNTTDGILVGGEGNILIEDNIATANGGYGLHSNENVGAPPIVYRGNLLLGNGTASAGQISPGRLDDQGGNLCTAACP